MPQREFERHPEWWKRPVSQEQKRAAQEKGEAPLPRWPDLSRPMPSSGLFASLPKKQVMGHIEDINEQLRSVHEFQRRTQERNEAFFSALLERQSRLENAIGQIYLRGIQEEKEILLRILLAIQRMRVEQGEISRTVEALRLWAKLIQRTGLPVDASLHSAVAALEQTVASFGGINQYMEICLPLVPGVLHYKVQLGSEHKGRLDALFRYLSETWQEVKPWGGK